MADVETIIDSVNDNLADILGTDVMTTVGVTPRFRNNFDKYGIAGTLDHTALGVTVSRNDVERLARQAINYNFASVCVPPSRVFWLKTFMPDFPQKIATVLSFPYGDDTNRVKFLAAQEAMASGADEVDMVVNISRVLENDWVGVYEDIKSVVVAVPLDIKVILETSCLNMEQKIATALIARAAGAAFVKTSTGMSSAGAIVEDIHLLRTVVGPNMGVKASGGIHDLNTARAMLDAGADRLGTSKSLAIVETITLAGRSVNF